MKLFKVLGGTALLIIGQSALATPYNEIGDADQLLPGQAVTAGTTSINGFIDAFDADLYSFIWDGGDLSIDTFGTGFDTQLFLFDSGGFGLQANDDSGGLQSQLVLTGLAAGTYYLGISAFNDDPNDNNGDAMFEFGASDPTSAGFLTSWDNDSSGGGDYVINFSAATGGGAPPMPTPEPGILMLLGLGLAGLGFARRRS